MSHLVFLDTETTSLDDTRGEVWEIGAILRREGHKDVEYLWEIRPDLTTADPMSLRVSRFYERHQLGAHEPGEAVELVGPLLKELGQPLLHMSAASVAAKLAELLDGAHVVGAVPDFDYRFLRRLLRKHGQCWTAHYHLIDVEALAVGYLAGVLRQVVDSTDDRMREATDLAMTATALPWSSTNLYRAVGVEPGGFEAHTALGDARLARAVYDAVMPGDVAW